MMQLDQYTLLGAFVTGLVLGALLVWVVGRGRRRSQIEVAVAQAQAAANVRAAAASTRSEQSEAARLQLQSERNDARARAEQVQVDLATAGKQNAQLTERAARIPALEGDLTRVRAELDAANQAIADLREANGGTIAQLTADLQAARDNLSASTSKLETSQQDRTTAETENARLMADLAVVREQLDADRRGFEEKLRMMTEARDALTNQFKALAGDILEEKSKRFTEQNQVNLNQLLDPLRTKIGEFQARVEQVHDQEGKDRSTLLEQVRQLQALNQTLSEDAKNLTTALKGSSKSHGNWGELVLERLLETSGLRKGEEYVSQESQVTSDGRKQQPDVVINLPDEKRLIIDSKVSLTAYERYISSETDAEREVALRQHLQSVRTHIRTLSEKDYPALYGLKSVDFALMFVPIEPAFVLAVTNDRDLFAEAWHSNVAVVSPSTLFFVLRTVAHIWRQEAQGRNALEIARRGAEMYDRLVGFVEDLKRVGERIGDAQDAYVSAQKRLSFGKDNVIRQAEMLKELGISPSKQFPQPFVDQAHADEELAKLMGPGTLRGEQVFSSERSSPATL